MKTTRPASPVRRPLTLVALALALAAPGLAGCAGSSDLMRPAAATPLKPAAGEATLVFFRPSRFGFTANFSIYDAKGTYFGEAVADSYFAVRLPPGGYTILAEGENTTALYAQVAAGKTYYVEVVPHFGLLRARVELEALRRGHADLPRVESWLRGRRLEPTTTTGLGKSGYDLDARVAEAKLAWDAQSDAERQEHTLNPEDGF
jgi:hypothetical protein